MFLKREDLEELTGYSSKAWQVKWLKKHHVPFTLKATGEPTVLQEDYARLYGLSVKYKGEQSQRVNIEAIRQKIK